MGQIEIKADINNKVNDYKIMNGFLILDLVNDDIGPFVKIFKINVRI